MPRSRIALCSWSLQPESPAALIDCCEELHINRVQLALSPVIHDGSSGPWAQVPAALREAGIEVVSGMMEMRGEDYSTLESIKRTGGVRPDETWADNLAHAKAVAGLAKRESIALVTFHAGFLPESKESKAATSERTKLLDRLRSIADIFAAHGIDLALETGQETAETLEHALDELNAPNVGVNFDPANMILYNMGDPISALRRLSPRVRQIHVKDALPSHQHGQWGTETPAGQGHVNWSAFFEVAKTLQHSVDFVIERESGESRMQDIALAKQLIRSHLDQR